MPQHGDDAHLGPAGPEAAIIDVESGEARIAGQAGTSSSMIRTERAGNRKTKKHSATMFEVKPSGELKYHADSSGAAPVAISAVGAMREEEVNQSASADVVAAVFGEDVKKDEEEGAAHDAASVDGLHSASGVDGLHSESATSGSLASDHGNATVHEDDLSALPMEKLALLQTGEKSIFPVQDVLLDEAKAVDGTQLPGEHLIGELLQEGGQASAKDAEHIKAERTMPFPGMGNVGDLAFRAMDMMLGTTGIIAEDYPFACICNEIGTCERDIQNTPCPHRAGQMAAARRSVSSGASVLFLATAILTVQIFC